MNLPQPTTVSAKPLKKFLAYFTADNIAETQYIYACDATDALRRYIDIHASSYPGQQVAVRYCGEVIFGYTPGQVDGQKKTAKQKQEKGRPKKIYPPFIPWSVASPHAKTPGEKPGAVLSEVK